ncbi:unnamed protein product [Lactuca virosa]|uniref:Uncharacterized protein n=1 Tax=Lactuca virosa TaxID=75947 RepID=A0AAU9N4X3_9ASTR|nr:unnamed protein product [Lactuca virosa]
MTTLRNHFNRTKNFPFVKRISEFHVLLLLFLADGFESTCQKRCEKSCRGQFIKGIPIFNKELEHILPDILNQVRRIIRRLVMRIYVSLQVSVWCKKRKIVNNEIGKENWKLSEQNGGGGF